MAFEGDVDQVVLLDDFLLQIGKLLLEKKAFFDSEGLKSGLVGRGLDLGLDRPQCVTRVQGDFGLGCAVELAELEDLGADVQLLGPTHIVRDVDWQDLGHPLRPLDRSVLSIGLLLLKVILVV